MVLALAGSPSAGGSPTATCSPGTAFSSAAANAVTEKAPSPPPPGSGSGASVLVELDTVGAVVKSGSTQLASRVATSDAVTRAIGVPSSGVIGTVTDAAGGDGGGTGRTTAPGASSPCTAASFAATSLTVTPPPTRLTSELSVSEAGVVVPAGSPRTVRSTPAASSPSVAAFAVASRSTVVL